MARTLREALAAKQHEITVGESLEIVARLFGTADWNTLSAIINNSERSPEPGNSHGRSGYVAFAPTTEEALHGALDLASDRGLRQATVEHLLLALTKDPDVAAVMKARGINLAAIREQTIHAVGAGDGTGSRKRVTPTPSPAFQKVVQRAILNVQRAGGGKVTGPHLLAAIFSFEDTAASRILRENGLE
jgi:hypothetical protein